MFSFISNQYVMEFRLIKINLLDKNLGDFRNQLIEEPATQPVQRAEVMLKPPV